MIARRPTVLVAIILCFCLPQSYCFAQDKPKVQFGKITAADFTVPAGPIIDTNTNAVILAATGSVRFVGNKSGWFSHVYKKQVRIKLLNKKAFNDLVTEKVVLYGIGERVEQLSDLTAVTYNLENGQVLETKLNKQDIFENRLSKERLEKKFTLPAVKEGSIIEYSYTITSDYNFRLPAWNFQSEEYPCLVSEYQVDIPQTLMYIFVRQGIHGFAVDKGSEGNESFKIVQKRDQTALVSVPDELIVSARTIKHQWVMKDIPALRPERYLSTPANYLDRIEFQLSKTYDGQELHDQANTWKKATEELLHEENFGGPLAEDNEWLTDLLDKAVANTPYGSEQARALYYYISSHFTCTNHYDPFIKTNFRDVVRKNSGTVGDINLLLTALLRKKGWQADPVLLSTREYGYNLATYPVFEKLNYVIVRLKLDGKTWYLDAAHPQLAFGKLAGNCYNGHARIISERDSASIYFEADSLKEKKTTLIFISSSDKGLEGLVQTTFGEQGSYDMRRYAAEHGQSNYFKDLQAGFGEDLTISNPGIDSLSLLEDPVKLHYEFRMNQEREASILYINPMLWSDTRNNPFAAATRKYPVEMPYVMDDAYIFSMEIPQGYVVDELPKSAKVAFNGDQGYFEYIIGQQENNIQLRCHIRLNKAWFAAEDYSDLRDFYGYIVKKESEHIVLKKK
jgi:hypothetical protein